MDKTEAVNVAFLAAVIIILVAAFVYVNVAGGEEEEEEAEGDEEPTESDVEIALVSDDAVGIRSLADAVPSVIAEAVIC